MFHYFVKALLLFILYFKVCAASTTDSMRSSTSLKDGDILVSAGQVFALGFFSPKDSKNRYLGIWFHNLTDKEVVWVANRNISINGSSGFLTIESDGNLVIYETNHSKVPLWSSNVTFPTSNKNLVAKLMDSGNLVLLLKDQQIWQSFDYPTDTKLASMKTGVSYETGLTWSLTSWKSYNDPGIGNYTYRIDPSGLPQLFIYRGSVPWWRAGSWNGKRWSGLPEMAGLIYYNDSYVDNDKETSSQYTMNDASVKTRLKLTDSGLIERHTWSDQEHQWFKSWWRPNDLCDYYGRCGPNSNCNPNDADKFECYCLPGFEPKSTQQWFVRDGSGGCVRKTGVTTCRSGEGFVKVEHVKVPDTSAAIINMSLDLKACEGKCLQNCSCLAYASAYSANGQGCLMWYANLMDTSIFSTMRCDLYVRVDAAELARYEKNDSLGKKLAAILVSSSIIAIILVAASAYWFIKKIKGRRSKHLPSILAINIEDSLLDETQRKIDLPLFDLSTIVKATNNFSPNNKLGEGGFGPVYKGVLKNGSTIAIKRLSERSGQGTIEFKNEIALLAKLQHKNLVKIHGYCIDKEEKMLIYEFLANKSLDTFIFDETNRPSLTWTLLFEIIEGIARGISYLHHDSRLRITHRDLKASNILLDAEMNPKVSDFGLARIFGGDQGAAQTNRVVGTYGYMSPEYAMEGRFSIKSDVYSFGILLLEILTGRKNIVYYAGRPMSNLVGHVWGLWEKGKIEEIIDSNLNESCLANEANRCIQIGLLCVQEEAMDRPNMLEVVRMLSSTDIPLPTPKQPGFVGKRTNNLDDEGSVSVDEVTASNSILLGR